MRTSPSPALEMRPSLSTDVPGCSRRGAGPKCAPTVFDLEKRAGSSIAALNVGATTGPTPGMAEPAAEFVLADQLHQQRMQPLVLAPQHCPAPQHALGGACKQGVGGDQCVDTSLEAGALDAAADNYAVAGGNRLL